MAKNQITKSLQDEFKSKKHGYKIRAWRFNNQIEANKESLSNLKIEKEKLEKWKDLLNTLSWLMNARNKKAEEIRNLIVSWKDGFSEMEEVKSINLEINSKISALQELFKSLNYSSDIATTLWEETSQDKISTTLTFIDWKLKQIEENDILKQKKKYENRIVYIDGYLKGSRLVDSDKWKEVLKSDLVYQYAKQNWEEDVLKKMEERKLTPAEYEDILINIDPLYAYIIHIIDISQSESEKQEYYWILEELEQWTISEKTKKELDNSCKERLDRKQARKENINNKEQPETAEEQPEIWEKTLEELISEIPLLTSIEGSDKKETISKRTKVCQHIFEIFKKLEKKEDKEKYLERAYERWWRRLFENNYGKEIEAIKNEKNNQSVKNDQSERKNEQAESSQQTDEKRIGELKSLLGIPSDVETEEVDFCILPPGKWAPVTEIKDKEKSWTWNKKEGFNKIWLLFKEILNPSHWFRKQDLHVVLWDDQNRWSQYIIIECSNIEKTIFVNNDYWEATYIYNWILNDGEIEENMTKDSLKEEKSKYIKINFYPWDKDENGAHWIKKVIKAILDFGLGSQSEEKITITKEGFLEKAKEYFREDSNKKELFDIIKNGKQKERSKRKIEIEEIYYGFSAIATILKLEKGENLWHYLTKEWISKILENLNENDVFWEKEEDKKEVKALIADFKPDKRGTRKWNKNRKNKIDKEVKEESNKKMEDKIGDEKKETEKNSNLEEADDIKDAPVPQVKFEPIHKLDGESDSVDTVNQKVKYDKKSHLWQIQGDLNLKNGLWDSFKGLISDSGEIDEKKLREWIENRNNYTKLLNSINDNNPQQYLYDKLKEMKTKYWLCIIKESSEFDPNFETAKEFVEKVEKLGYEFANKEVFIKNLKKALEQKKDYFINMLSTLLGKFYDINNSGTKKIRQQKEKSVFTVVNPTNKNQGTPFLVIKLGKRKNPPRILCSMDKKILTLLDHDTYNTTWDWANKTYTLLDGIENKTFW